MKSVRVIPVSAVLSRVPYGYVFLHMGRIPRLNTWGALAGLCGGRGRVVRGPGVYGERDGGALVAL